MSENTKLIEENSKLKALLGLCECPVCRGYGSYVDEDGAEHKCQWCEERKSIAEREDDE